MNVKARSFEVDDRVDAGSVVKLAAYASLLNQKIVILSSSSDYIAVDHHFFANSLRPLINRIRFDEAWYLEMYPDVRQAIAKKVVANAKEHYERFGYFEHRMPYEIKVQEQWYLEQYPDVKEALGRRGFTTGQAHFEINGFREGRIPYPHFELEYT